MDTTKVLKTLLHPFYLESNRDVLTLIVSLFLSAKKWDQWSQKLNIVCDCYYMHMGDYCV